MSSKRLWPNNFYMSTENNKQPDTAGPKKAGTVFINDPVIGDAKSWVDTHGSTMSWFFSTGAKLLLKEMRLNPTFLDTLDVTDYKGEPAG